MIEFSSGVNSNIYAKVIADSVPKGGGPRLITIEGQFHRFVLAEFNTHRAFSRNSASSRAIPFTKQLQQVIENPAVPISFPSEKPGMQGGEKLTGAELEEAKAAWLDASLDAAKQAMRLRRLGVHKSVINRLLEPFLWHKVIFSSTEMENFYEQRVSPLAQPEIHEFAHMVRLAAGNSDPEEVAVGERHLPYIETEDYEDPLIQSPDDLARVSAARCALVSGLNLDGTRSVEKDLNRYRKLVTAEPPHWSPLEHVARPARPGEKVKGNFDGWVQLRHEPLPGG